jgi:hypothetical protein
MYVEAGGYREVDPTVGENRIGEVRHTVCPHALRRLQVVNLVLGGDRLGPAQVGKERPAGLVRPAELGRVLVHSAASAHGEDGFAAAQGDWLREAVDAELTRHGGIVRRLNLADWLNLADKHVKHAAQAPARGPAPRLRHRVVIRQ